MSIHSAFTTKVDYQSYRFGRSRQRFRGPQPDLSKPYISFIGGSETFGKFAPSPYPQLIEERIGVTCANWGTPGAGPSFFLKDPVVLEACSNSKICVVSVMGAVAMSNRLYAVFKRRNSRLLSTSTGLRAMFPELNLDEYRFAHNMLRNMYRDNPQNFKVVEIELREAWVARMRELLDEIETCRVLLWMSERAPDEGFEPSDSAAFVTHPAFVTRDMLEAIAPMADLIVEYVPGFDGEKQSNGSGGEDEPALPCPSPLMHEQTAELLAPPLQQILKTQAKSKRTFGFGDAGK